MEMMVRKKALRHAAKVAFGSLVVGCGGTMSVNDGGPTTDASAGHDAQLDSAVADAVSDAPVDSPLPFDGSLECLGPVDFDASVDTTSFQCCVGLIEQDMGDAGWTVDDAGTHPPGSATVQNDPSSYNCCKAIIAHVDSNTADYSAASPTLATCCSVTKGPVGPACTPWGPPMPPEMTS